MSSQVTADLRAAAEELELNGWTRGQYVREDGCHCAVGAVVAVLDGTKGEDSVPARNANRAEAVRVALRSFVNANGTYNWTGIIEWNDATGRTAAEVIATLRAAADEADQS